MYSQGLSISRPLTTGVYHLAYELASLHPRSDVSRESVKAYLRLPS